MRGCREAVRFRGSDLSTLDSLIRGKKIVLGEDKVGTRGLWFVGHKTRRLPGGLIRRETGLMMQLFRG